VLAEQAVGRRGAVFTTLCSAWGSVLRLHIVERHKTQDPQPLRGYNGDGGEKKKSRQVCVYCRNFGDVNIKEGKGGRSSKCKKQREILASKSMVLGDGRFAVFILSPLDFSYPVSRDYGW